MIILTLVLVLAVLLGGAPAQAADIKLVINGQPVQSDVPPIIVDSRTLVPVRVVSENLGALVSYDHETRTVSVDMGGTSIQLRLGSREAVVNGRVVLLDVPAQIIGSRTMVPLRFIGESLGAQVGWDQATRTVTVNSYRIVDIQWEKGVGRARITVKLTGPAQYSVKALDRTATTPYRLILDLTPAEVALSRPVIAIREAGVTYVRAGSLGVNPRRARVVVDLVEPVKYYVSNSPDGREIYIDIQYKVERVSFDVLADGAAIFVRTSGPVEYETMVLEEPARLVLDVKGVSLGVNLPEVVPVGNGVIDRIRVGQFKVDPDVVRIVADLKRPVQYRVETREHGIYVFIQPRLVDVRLQESDGVIRLTVTADLPVTYEVSRLKAPDRLVVDLPGVALGMPAGELPVSSGVVQRLAVGQLQVDPDVARVVVELPHYMSHTVLSSPGSAEVVVDISTSPVRGVKIAIDAGHGGKDPGAIGPAGTYEKEVNLAVAKLVRDLLAGAGAQVLMIREGDETVPLFERPSRANSWDADLYVSIHCNSYRTQVKTGTEVYYYRNHPSSADLAQALQEELIRALGLVDRGVRTERFVVLRETRMPSALLELAFISSPLEEKLLVDPGFQRRAAQAIFQGIVRYLRESR